VQRLRLLKPIELRRMRVSPICCDLYISMSRLSGRSWDRRGCWALTRARGVWQPEFEVMAKELGYPVASATDIQTTMIGRFRRGYFRVKRKQCNDRVTARKPLVAGSISPLAPDSGDNLSVKINSILNAGLFDEYKDQH
jgi:hypothetical protein